MKKEKTVNEGYIRDALKLEMDVPEGVNERIMRSAARRRRHSARIYKLVPAIAACVAIVLLSGAAVNAATGGGLLRFLTKPAEGGLYMPEGSEIEVTEITWTDGKGTEHDFVSASVGGDSTTIHAGAEEDSLVEMIIPIGADEKPGERMYTFRASVAPWSPTGLDMYYAIREQFPACFDRVNPDKIDVVIAAMRDMVKAEEREEVRKGVLDAIDDFENGRQVMSRNFVCYRKMEDWEEDSEDGKQFTNSAGERWTLDYESNDWICEDITDIADPQYYLIADSAYGTGRTYILKIESGKKTMSIYSEECMEEANESGLPIYDRRK